MRLILALLFLFYPASVWADPTFDNFASYLADGSGATASTTFAIGGGCTNPFLVIQVYTDASDSVVTSVIADAGSLTQIGPTMNYTNPDTTQYKFSLWGIASASLTGTTQNITVNLDVSSLDIGTAMRSYCGVDQATPLGTQTNANACSTDVTSAAGELVIDAALAGPDDTFTPDASQTQRYNYVPDYVPIGGSDKTGAGSVTMTWGADCRTIIAVPLKPSTAAPVAHHKPMVLQ